MVDRLYSGHGPCWKAAQQLGFFTYQSLADAAGVSYDVASRNVRHWEQHEAVRLTEVGPHKTRHFALTGRWVGDPLPEPSRQVSQTPETFMWNAMRQMPTFSPVDLTAMASTEEVEITPELARKFIGLLMRGEYLRVVRKAVPGKKPAIYKLIKATGPFPPVERRVSGVYDPNTEDFAYLAQVKS